MRGRGIELYIHIPFCVRKCAYCDFLSFPADSNVIQSYVDALCTEIRCAGDHVSERLETVYLGGGTPSLLDGAQIEAVMGSVRSSFEVACDAEISIECNPGTVDIKKLKAMRRAGINRISFGLQSCDDSELTLLGRIHSFEDFADSFRLAREAGFDNINVDLMFALPGQSSASFKKSIQKVAQLEPEHISAYSLIPEEGTPLYEKIAKGELSLQDEAQDRKMYREAVRLLKTYGYERYEISNFAREGYACRHNEGYWTGIPYLGAGLGASGYYRGVRYNNISTLNEYLNQVNCGGSAHGFAPAACDVHEVTEKEQMEEFMFLGLRRAAGIREDEFKQRFLYDISEVYGDKLTALRGQRLIRKQKGSWMLTAKGIDVSNHVLADFLLDDLPLPVWRLSVRSLVEFLLRAGDLNRVSQSGTSVIEAMQLGAAIHRKLQSERPAHYRPEVPLSAEIDLAQVRLIIEGRADGICGSMIEEIKSVSGPVSKEEGPREVHLAQAKCYAAIYAHDNTLSEVSVRVTYCHAETRKITQWDYTYEAGELWDWFIRLARDYEKWAVLRAVGRRERDQSITSLHFPFEYRAGQKRLIAGIYQSIRQERQLFVQAPTGSGKTLAALYPAVRSLGEGLITRIWYLTAKTVTRSVAQEGVQLLMNQGLKMRTVTLTARERICLCEDAVCDPEVCPYAKGHFDRVNDALYELLTDSFLMERRTICRIAEKHSVCPYALERDAAGFSDAVICDYNYVLDPEARLTDYFLNGQSKRDLFLIDEAHNLIDRARGMYSAVLDKSDFLHLGKQMKESAPKLSEELARMNRLFLGWKSDPYEIIRLSPSDVPADQLTKLRFSMDHFIEQCEKKQKAVPDELWNLYFEINHFQNMFEAMDERFCVYAQTGRRGKVTLHLYCLDPSMMISSYLLQGRSSVFFSATMLPIPYYEKLLTVSEDVYDMYAESPFDPEHLKILIGRDVTSLYQSRGPQMYSRMAEYISRTVGMLPGNYLVFFPSYAFMEEVCAYLPEAGGGHAEGHVKWLVQKPDMTEAQKEDFLAAFSERSDDSVAGLCVLGGAFSEGIDLRGERLIGVIVIGTGIPQVGNRLNLTREYFDKNGMDGFSYTYVYPGFNKVMQAVGRVIRTAEDTGMALLLDYRFLQARYRKLFPREWKCISQCTIETLYNSIGNGEQI